MYGDSYLNVEFKSINEYFVSENALGLMTVLENDDRWDLSNVEFVNGKILNYDKENLTNSMKYIDFGLGILHKKAFDSYKKETVFDLADIYKNLIKRDELLGYAVEKRFYEIGSQKGLAETREYFAKLHK